MPLALEADVWGVTSQPTEQYCGVGGLMNLPPGPDLTTSPSLGCSSHAVAMTARGRGRLSVIQAGAPCPEAL